MSSLIEIADQHVFNYETYECSCGTIFAVPENWTAHVIRKFEEAQERVVPIVIRENYVVNIILPKLQAEIAMWSNYNFGDQSCLMPLLGVYEEAGELAHAVLKGIQGIRGTTETNKVLAQDAVGDIVIYLIDFCSRYGIDFEHSILTAWQLVKQRDWRLYPKNGRTE